jgi:hypothetical protein
MEAFLLKVFKLLLPLFRALGKALLLPLIKGAIQKIIDHFEMKRIKKENEQKADDYVKAETAEEARKAFKDLP